MLRLAIGDQGTNIFLIAIPKENNGLKALVEPDLLDIFFLSFFFIVKRKKNNKKFICNVILRRYKTSLYRFHCWALSLVMARLFAYGTAAWCLTFLNRFSFVAAAHFFHYGEFTWSITASHLVHNLPQ